MLVSQAVSSGCLLGRDSASKLGLLTIINSVSDNVNLHNTKVSQLLSDYKDVTIGLGKLKNVQIKLDINEAIKPVSQHLRKIHCYLRKRIDEKLDELIELDVIPVPETDLTPWISPLLAVPKRKGIR